MWFFIDPACLICLVVLGTVAVLTLKDKIATKDVVTILNAIINLIK